LRTCFERAAFPSTTVGLLFTWRILACLLVLPLLDTPAQGDPASRETTLVLLSLDGVRHDYPERVKGGAFEKLAREGSRADRLIPPFPASTFPAHATLATGCYPERHGILNSRFLDTRRGEYDRSEDPGWLACEPIWITAERQGLKSAVLNWSGSFGQWGGRAATYHEVGFQPRDNQGAIDQVLDWLRLPPAARPRLVAAYLAGADHEGHEGGPDSVAVNRKLQSLDRLLSRLLRGIEGIPESEAFQVMRVSDHGMATRRGWLDPQAALADAHVTQRTFTSGGTANVYLGQKEDRERAVKALSGLPGLEIFFANTLPQDLRYSFPGRIGDLILLAPVGVELGKERGPDRRRRGGVHGYRGTAEEMGGIFYGWGTAFQRGAKISSVEAAEIYSLACAVLGIRPSPQAQGRVPLGLLMTQEEGKVSTRGRR